MERPRLLAYWPCLIPLASLPFQFFVILMLVFSFDAPSSNQGRAYLFFSQTWVWYAGFFMVPCAMALGALFVYRPLPVAKWVSVVSPFAFPIALIILRLVL